jgi:hypothetical protein
VHIIALKINWAEINSILEAYPFVRPHNQITDSNPFPLDRIHLLLDIPFKTGGNPQNPRLHSTIFDSSGSPRHQPVWRELTVAIQREVHRRESGTAISDRSGGIPTTVHCPIPLLQSPTPYPPWLSVGRAGFLRTGFHTKSRPMCRVVEEGFHL